MSTHTEKDYYGTKLVTAWPQMKDGAEGYAVKYNDGYTSWSPKEAFEAAYQLLTAMSFSHALTALKDGKRVCRAGWNGKGMWLRIFHPYSDIEFTIRDRVGAPLDCNSGTLLSWIGMHTADKCFVPWLASQTDILANDWMIVGS